MTLTMTATCLIIMRRGRNGEAWDGGNDVRGRGVNESDEGGGVKDDDEVKV